MARFSMLDARDAVVSNLSDVTTGLAIEIAAVNTRRSLSAPLPAAIGTTPSDYQYPQVVVRIGAQSAFPEDGRNIPDAELLKEEGTILVKTALKGAETALTDHLEVYIEAILSLLHNRSLSEHARLSVRRVSRRSNLIDGPKSPAEESAELEFSLKIG